MPSSLNFLMAVCAKLPGCPSDSIAISLPSFSFLPFPIVIASNGFYQSTVTPSPLG